MLNELQQKLGEAYSTLLPETVPFLAELMEGKLVLSNLFYINSISYFPSILQFTPFLLTDEEVEKHCQLLISEMEKTFGESLQKYF